MALTDPYASATPAIPAQPQQPKPSLGLIDPYAAPRSASDPDIFGGPQPHKVTIPQHTPHDPYATEPVPQNVGSAGTPDARWTRRYDRIIEDAAAKHKIDPRILRGILATETNGSPSAQSPVGAVGLGQFMPGTGKEMGLFDQQGHDLRGDPIKSIYASARYLSRLISDQNGDVIKAVASYNAGEGNVAKYGIDGITETRNYWRRVLSVAQKYGYGTMPPPTQFLTMAAPEHHPPKHIQPGTPQHQQAMQAGIGLTAEAITSAISGANTLLHKALASRPFQTAMIPVNWIADIASRPDQANLARHAGRSFWGTMIHGESPQQYQKDTELATQQFINAKWLGGSGHLDLNHLPAYRRFIDEFVTQSLYDPTILLSKVGLFRKLGVLSEAHVLPAAQKVSSLAHEGAATGNAAQRAVSHVVRAAAAAVGAAHHLLGVHSDAKKYLAATHGPGWVDQYAHTLAIKGGQRQMASVGTAVFHEKLTDILQGLKDSEKMKVFRALHGGTVEDLSGKPHQAASEISQWTDSIAHLQGDDVLRGTLEVNHGFQLPEYAKPFLTEDGSARGLMAPENYRENYITISHELAALSGEEEAQKEFLRHYEMASGKARTFDELQREDPFLRPRNDPKGLPNDPTLFENALRNRVSSAFGAITAFDAQQALKKQYGGEIPKAIEKLFTHDYKFQDQLSSAEQAGLMWKNVMDWGKSSLFAIPMPHMTNIGILTAINNLGALPHGVALLGDMYKMTATQRLAKYREEIANGIIGEPHKIIDDERTLSDLGKSLHAQNIDDKSPAFVRGLNVMARSGLAKYTGTAPLVRQIANLYKWSNRTLWSWDDAMKIATFRAFKKQFHDPARAAYETLAALVDYSTRSPLGEGARYLDNFATWTTKKPIAVTRALIRHPELVSAVTRLNPTLGGGTQNIGGQDYKGVGPIAETGQLGSALSGNTAEAVRLLRSRLTPQLQAGMGAAPGLGAMAPEGYQGKMPYWTYGNDPLLYGLVQASGIFTPLQYFGIGAFTPADKKPSSIKDVALTVAKNMALQSARLSPEAKANAKQAYIDQQAKAGVPIWQAEKQWYKDHPKMHLGGFSGMKL